MSGPALRRLIAVALLTAIQFTALPFLTMVAANDRYHGVELQPANANMTVVYKTAGSLRV